MIEPRELVRIIYLSKKNQGGFTLLELIIVIIIVGTLSAIAVPSLLAQVDKARYAEAKVQMSAIAKELTKVYPERGIYEYPNGDDLLLVLGTYDQPYQ